MTFQNISCYCLTFYFLPLKLFWKISKHLMLLFNCFRLQMITKENMISKHLMLLFNEKSKKILICRRAISKHLMLLFNTLAGIPYFLLASISKHLMLLFNDFLNNSSEEEIQFQNISCYCLTNDFTSFFNGLF